MIAARRQSGHEVLVRVRDEKPSEDQERKQLDADQDQDHLRQPLDRHKGDSADHKQHDHADRGHRALTGHVARGVADRRTVEGCTKRGQHEWRVRGREVGVGRQDVGERDTDGDPGHRPKRGRDDAGEVDVLAAGAGDGLEQVLVGEHRNQPDRRAQQERQRHVGLVEGDKTGIEVDERVDDGDRRQRDASGGRDAELADEARRLACEEALAGGRPASHRCAGARHASPP